MADQLPHTPEAGPSLFVAYVSEQVAERITPAIERGAGELALTLEVFYNQGEAGYVPTGNIARPKATPAEASLYASLGSAAGLIISTTANRNKFSLLTELEGMSGALEVPIPCVRILTESERDSGGLHHLNRLQGNGYALNQPPNPEQRKLAMVWSEGDEASESLLVSWLEMAASLHQSRRASSGAG